MLGVCGISSLPFPFRLSRLTSLVAFSHLTGMRAFYKQLSLFLVLLYSDLVDIISVSPFSGMCCYPVLA